MKPKEQMNKIWRYKNNRYIHDGDCYFWGSDICTCGLLHHLMLNPPVDEKRDSYEEWYCVEMARHQTQLDRINSDRRLKPLPYKKPTEEELKERQKILDDIFPGNEIDLLKD